MIEQSASDAVATSNGVGTGAKADRTRRERQARFRQRKREGLVPISLDMSLDEVALLVERGVLPEARRNDRYWISAAAEKVLISAFHALADGRLSVPSD